MSLRVLLTGFEAFPGAPYNPTPALIESLKRLRRPALADVAIATHVFPVTYTAVDSQLAPLLAREKPDVLLMFGLATRTPYVRVETRARNAVTTLWPDAGERKALKSAVIVPDGPGALAFGPFTAQLLHRALTTGVPVHASRDAGRYLCNYLSWRALESAGRGDAPRLTTFIHVPNVPRAAGLHRGRVTAQDLTKIGTEILLSLVALARRG
jgi:pyroglutamyl-peptidase